MSYNVLDGDLEVLVDAGLGYHWTEPDLLFPPGSSLYTKLTISWL